MHAVSGRMSPVNTRQVKVDFLPHDLVYFLLNEDSSIISQISLCSAAAASAALQHQCGVHLAGGNILIKYFNKMTNKVRGSAVYIALTFNLYYDVFL